MFRGIITSSSRNVSAWSSKALHTTPVAAKTVTQKTKETASNVNLKVGKKLAGAIETGEKITASTKETLGGGSVKDVADNVNKAVGRGLASVIEKGEEVADATKETLGTTTAKSKQVADQAATKVKGAANVAGQKANQAAAGVREDFQADVKKELRK